MSASEASVLYRRIGRLRWQAPVLAVLLVLAHQVVEHTWLRQLPYWEHFLTQVLFYGIVGPFLAWWALTSLRRQVRETEVAERALQQTHKRLRKANERLSFLMRVNRRLAEADDEEPLIETILELPEEVVPVAAVSLVRLDERGQPLPPRFRGNLAPEIMDAWAAHIANAQAGQACATCQTRTADLLTPCSLLHAVPATAGVQELFCLSLARGRRRYGVLNIYLREEQRLTGNERSLLQAMAREITLALESHSLRTQELLMLSRMQQTHWWRDAQAHLTGVLQRTVEALEADGGAFTVDPLPPGERYLNVTVGEAAEDNLRLLARFADSSREGSGPLILQDVQHEALSSARSLLAVPLQTEGEPAGTLMLWAGRAGAFSQRQAHLAAVVAGQAALLLENRRLSLQVEHQAALAERARLAREIHDGLAQTLGYLKLRTAGLTSALHREEAVETIAAELREVQQLLDDAYVDAREAIDGLQLVAAGSDLESWLREVVRDFEILSGVPATIDPGPDVHLPREAQVQLQRIVQEALSNVRKHAAAGAVRVNWEVEEDARLALRVEDDGCGFAPHKIGVAAQHGLRIMRERAELMGAALQVTSGPGEGTRVTVRLALSEAVPLASSDALPRTKRD